MDLYDEVSSELARVLTRRYSTSFSSAARLFATDIRKHIYNIYALVRIADEIVDTYQGKDRLRLLDDLEGEVSQAQVRGYSANPIVHAYVLTSNRFGISDELTGPFFESMRMDTRDLKFTKKQYASYIYGSAEVVGLMCLRVFCEGDDKSYDLLKEGARKLGSAYQKVNFLRDIAADHDTLHRYYFPGSSYASFNDEVKREIVTDIQQDFAAAEPYIRQLPKGARRAVTLSYRYYAGLLGKLERTPAATIKAKRVRLPRHRKSLLLAAQVTRIPR